MQWTDRQPDLDKFFKMEDFSGCDCRLCKHREDITRGTPPQCRFYHDGRCHGYEYAAEFDISNSGGDAHGNR